MTQARPNAIRLRGRNLWFQVHKWIGLLLFLLLIPVSASGSLLVWHGWIDRIENPERYAVSDGPATLPPQRYLESARSRLKTGDRFAAIEFPEAPGRPVMVTVSPDAAGPERAGPPPRYQLWLDPADARVVDQADAREGVLRWLHVFHGSLMITGAGRTIVGWLGVAMLISALSGIWLWLPTTTRWLRGFRWKRGPLVSGNLHHLGGIWMAIPLALLSFTGAWISFPGFFGRIERMVASAPEKGPGAAPDRRARPAAVPRLGADAVLEAARRAAGGGDAAQLRWPTEASPQWRVALRTRGETVELDVDDRAATVAPAPPARSGAALFMRRLHDGNGYNVVWQTIIFIGGLAPALLGITGVIMWLRTRGWRRRASVRRTVPV
jgi:uncharacterized iron-regulated membrane protein